MYQITYVVEGVSHSHKGFDSARALLERRAYELLRSYYYTSHFSLTLKARPNQTTIASVTARDLSWIKFKLPAERLLRTSGHLNRG